VTIPAANYSSTEAAVSVLYDVVERVEAIPGVVAAGLANGLPFTSRIVSQSVDIVGRETSSEPWLAPLAMRFHVLPGYFETMHIPLLAGRTLGETDGIGAPLAMVVSESMATRWWPGESPIGAQVTFWGRTFNVVGVVGDVRREALDRGFEETVYVSLAQVPLLSFNLFARTNRDPSRVVPQLREAIWSVDPALPVTNAGTMESFMHRTANPQWYGSLLMGVFGVLASAIAAVGVFGVAARTVMSRTHELGIRIALGARGRQLAGMVLGDSMLIGFIGTFVGLIAAATLTRLMSAFLFGVEPSDPLTFIVVAGLLLLTCAAASYIPARRVSRVDPMKVIRAE
jgi:putative ABC transport system permease protein